MIDELKFRNFRGFASLDLKGLKRVNLVVGENNAGKTSLLEAILLLCEPERASQLPGMFRAVQGNSDTRYFRWLLHDGAAGQRGELCGRHQGTLRKLLLAAPAIPIASEISGASPQYFYKGSILLLAAHVPGPLLCRFVSVQQRDPGSVVALVGKAQRRSGGEEVLQRLLAAVDPRIRKVRVDPGEDGNQVIVDIGLSELIPVAQAGQGVYRLLTILADIIGEKPDVLLIDEVENGLHHSIHRQIWAGLAEAAEKLEVQIFATTHSDECLRAAHAAFTARQSYDLGIVQLFRVSDGIQGRVLDRAHVEAAIQGNIDLR